jgi:hypothetical protein
MASNHEQVRFEYKHTRKITSRDASPPRFVSVSPLAVVLTSSHGTLNLLRLSCDRPRTLSISNARPRRTPRRSVMSRDVWLLVGWNVWIIGAAERSPVSFFSADRGGLCLAACSAIGT